MRCARMNSRRKCCSRGRLPGGGSSELSVEGGVCLGEGGMKRNSGVQEGEPHVQTSPRGASTSQAEMGREGGSCGPSMGGEEAGTMPGPAVLY